MSQDPPALFPSEPAPRPGVRPGRTLGVVGLVLAVFTGLIGALVSVIAYRQSAAAGWRNKVALVGIVVGVVIFLVSLVRYLAAGTAGATGVL